MSELDFDIFIVGGGLVGCALAQALRDTPLKIGISDLVLPDIKTQAEYDARALAISYRSHLILKSLEVWPMLQAEAASVKQVHVSEKGKLGMTRVDCVKEGVSALGYILEMPNLNRCFVKALESNKNVHWFVPAEMISMQRTAEGIAFTMMQSGEQKIGRTKLLVIASGARSALRDSLGIRAISHPYEQHALVINVGLDRDLAGWAYERFTPDGPIACLPLRRGSATIVWTMSPAQLEQRLALPEEDFKEALQNTFGYRAGNITWVGKRQSFPLHLQVANEQIRDRIVILGNAAHNLHPVAGQGFNLSLRDVMRLSSHLKAAVGTKEDFSAYRILQNYLADSLRDQHRMTQYTHGLVKGFSNRNSVLSFLRNSALLSLDFLPPLKSRIAQHNMGF